MADLILDISAEFLKNLEKADKRIMSISNVSFDAKNKLQQMFKIISQEGAGAAVSHLKSLRENLELISKASVKVEGFDKLSSDIQNSIDKINLLVRVLSQVDKNAINEKYFDLSRGRGGLGSENKKEYEKEYREREKLFDQAIREESERKAKQISDFAKWQLDAISNELQAKRQAEADMQATRKRNLEEYKQLWINLLNEKDAQEKRQSDAKASNKKIRSNSAQAAKAYEEQLRMYARMFDEIEKREKEASERSKRNKQKELDDKIRAEQEYAERMKAIRRAENERERKQIEDELRRKKDANRRYLSTYEGAMKVSNNAKSLYQEQQAIKYLKEARAKLSKSDADYVKKLNEINRAIDKHNKSIAKATGQTKKFGSAQKELLNVAGKLKTTLLGAFSVQQLMGYIKKVVDIRKEFELQHKSLQIIIQDTDAANKLWGQTVDLALKSPFRVKELIKYTKQLAAYRIETDKLHDTTKRLADMSAGLGVDMQRLILAYGQVRAAEYLRGTELRQFTEAGVPMLDELAKYFSELENAEVTTAEVFERISKRMVSFNDVENVIKRMTDAGGVFYKMQEQQAQTLHGMISNLYDSIDLMINKIGQDNDGTMKGVVQTAKELVDNYEDILDVLSMWAKILTPIAGVTLLVKVANSKLALSLLSVANSTKIGFAASIGYEKMLTNIGKKSKFAAVALRYLGKALGGLGFVAIAAGAALLVKKLSDMYLEATKMDRLAKRLEKSLGKIFTEDTSNLDKNIKQFDNLIERLKIANEGSQERRDIMDKMNSQYGQYLDFVVDEKTSIDDLNNSYENIIARMKERASLATYERGVKAIEENYGDALTDAVEEFYDLFESGNIFSKNKTDFALGAGLIPTEEEIDDIYSIVQQKINELDASAIDSAEEQRDLIQNILREYYDSSEIVYGIGNKTLEIVDILVEKKKKEADLQKQIDSQYKATLKSQKANLALREAENKYAIEQNKIRNEENLSNFDVLKKLQEAKDNFELEKIRIEFEFGEISEEVANKRRDAIINWEKGTIKSINDMIKSELGSSYSDEELSKVLITREKQAKGINSILKDIQDTWERHTNEIKEQVSLQSEGHDIDEDKLANAIKMEELYRKAADIMGIELEYTQRMSEEMRNSLNELLPEEQYISIEDSYKGVSNIVSEIKKKSEEYKTTIELINEAKKNGLPYDEKALLLAEENYKWAKKKLDLLDPDASTPIDKGRADAINAKLEEKYRLNAIDLQESEVELLKQANDEKEKAIAWQEQMNNMIAQGAVFTKEEVANASKAVEQYTLRWKLLGGTDKDKKGGKDRQNSLYDERIKVIDDMSKKYEELRKTLSETESLQGAFNAYIDAFATAFDGISWIPKNVREMTTDEFVSKVLGFPDKDNLVSFLDKLSKEPMKNFEKIKVELAKGKYFEEMTLDARKISSEQMTKSIEDMFGKYELSLELQKLDIPQDFAKELFDIDVSSLGDITAKINKELASGMWGKDVEDKLKEFQRKVAEMEAKEQAERLKTYLKYTRDAIGERAKIKLEELRKLDEIEQTFEKQKRMAVTTDEYRRLEEAKQRAILGVKKESLAEMQKLEWEQFKSSDVFINMFNDLDNASTKAIDSMIDQLEKYKKEWSNLPVDQMKEVAKQLERMKKAQTERAALANPFDSGFMQTPSYKERQNAEMQILNTTKMISDINASIANDELKMQEYAEGKLKLSEEEYNQLFAHKASLVIQLGLLEGYISRQQKIIDNYDLQKKKLKAQSDALGQCLDAANDLYDAFKGLAEALGADADSPAMIFADMGMNMANTVIQTLQLQLQLKAATVEAGTFAAAMNSAMGVIGWIVMGVQLLTAAINAIVQAHDNNLQKQIESWQVEVESLQESYENLSDVIEEAYSLVELEKYSREMQHLNNQMIDAYKEMIALEEAKKQTDDDAIKDMEKSIDDLQSQNADLLKNMFSEATDGILDSVKDAARDFTDAWFDAFKETGDGMKGLEDTFNEMIANMIKQQISMSVVSPYLERWKNQLEGYIDPKKGDLTLSIDEANKFAETVKNEMPYLNESLENAFRPIADLVNLYGDAGDLTGLQKGIQGITETQAEEISAYLNSIRFFISQQNDTLLNLAQRVLSVNDAENPIVAQLRIIATQTTAINELLNSLTTPFSGGGRGFKVVI